MDQPTKSFNSQGGKNRLRFASAKSRAKKASADVYRSSDNNRLSARSSTAVREKRVHDTSFVGSGKKKKRKKGKGIKKTDDGKSADGEKEQDEVRYFGRDNDSEGLGIGRTAVIVSSKSKLKLAENVEMDVDEDNEDAILEEEEEEHSALISGGTIFLSELEISGQRNGSQLFQKMVRELRPLSKSLAELLHHSERIVDVLYAYLLSPRGNGGMATPCRRSGSSGSNKKETWKAYKKHLSSIAPNGYTVNVATNDILHLLGVLSRELRQELFPYLTSRILPRIIDDMLNPPTVLVNDAESDDHKQIVLDVSLVESAFRTISYLFKYNADQIINNGHQQQEQTQKQSGGDADILRQYYGKTICHKRDIVRRLACEAYAPLLRKCLDGGLKRHMSRTVKALSSSLAAASAASVEDGSDEEMDEVEAMTNSAKRARSDAIDGVSTLLFEVARGAPGRVHSKKGRLVVRTLLECLVGSTKKKKDREGSSTSSSLGLGKNKAQAMYEVASQFLYKIRGHVARRNNDGEQDMAGSAFSDVLDEMHRALDQATSVMKESLSQETVHYIVGHMISLMTETIKFQDGRLLANNRGNSTEALDRVSSTLQELLGKDIFSKAGRKLQDQILRYLCSAWRANPSHPSFALRLGKFFPSIVAPSDSEKSRNLDPALFLGEHLLPYLPKKVASTYLMPALLGAAASSPKDGKHGESSLVLLHTIATTVWPSKGPDHTHDIDIDDAAADALFTLEAAEYCPDISAKLRSSLFDICLSQDLEQLSSGGKRKSKKISSSQGGATSLKNTIACIGYASRCIPFLVCLECSSGGDGDNSEGDDESSVNDSQSDEVLNRVFKWCTTVMKNLDTIVQAETERQSSHAFVSQSLVLESLSKSMVECHQRVSSPTVISTLKKTLAKAKLHANSLLFLHPKSFWVVRGVAAVTKASSAIDPGSKLNDKSNDTFELLVPNLAEPNHFLRLYTLQILDSYPARPFVTDHADLDLTDDLDEDPSYRPKGDGNYDDEKMGNADATPGSSLSGSCDVISLLAMLESIPIALPNERKLTNQLSRVEVYARTGKLPIVYAEAVACHMLGLLHVKFSPIWPAAVKAMVSLSLAQEGPAWPYIEAALKLSMKKTSAENKGDEDNILATTDSETDHPNTGTIAQHHSLCVAWEKSRGKNIDIFGSQDIDRNAQVSRHVTADELTLFESIWSIMENAPHLTATKSKVAVPIFFEFLKHQYYVFHQDEPDTREIDLSSIVESHNEWPKEILGRKSMQKKLESFLKMFAAVKGPQQLFKHKILLQIFVAFLANPDPKLSNLAFACVLRYKLPYLTPYVDHIQPMLKKEGLREALTKFDLSKDSEVVDAEHRLSLVPIVTRILFGRFSSRGNGGSKSSKDSPAARRAAILSFFSGIGNESGELNYFVYMMVRAFIPRDVDMTSDGLIVDSEPLVRLIEASEKITAKELEEIPAKRQEGFLNLLSDVITQIGFGVKHSVGTFMNLLLALCEQTEHALVTSIKNQALKNESPDNESEDGGSRVGKIRSLAFLRLGDMFTKFASSVDFTELGQRLWKSMSSSVIALPNTVINAENPPSLLQLIESISVHQRLIPLLQQSDDVIIAVFKCVAGTTRVKVMNTVLRIIDGLLTEGGTLNDAATSSSDHSIGQKLILEHIHLLIAQFTNRLTKDSQIAKLDESMSRGYVTKTTKQNPMEGLQLNILCRVSELLVSAGQAEDDHVATMEDLCDLLVPLMKFDSHPNQLYVVRTVNSLLPKISSEAAMSHFHALSKLLGPNKNQAGITSTEHRKILSSSISAICSRESGPKWKQISKAVEDINAVSTSYVDEHDFERMLPVLNGLGSEGGAEGSWFNLSLVTNQSKAIDGTRILLPLMYTCFHLLYDSDGVVSRAANKGLKSLVGTSSEQASEDSNHAEGHRKVWVKLIETAFVPCLKIGLSTKEVATRRSFVLLIAHVARNFTGIDSVHLYGDLRVLIRDDDQDLDFFLNITHVQLHRRARGLGRLRKLLAAHGSSAEKKSPLFSDQSLGNILLPLAMHPIYEYKSKSEEAYVIEAIATVGEISNHLPWSKYNNTLQSALNSLERFPDQERYLIAMVCSIIDAFHFTVETGEGNEGVNDGQGNGVWRSLNSRIIPKVESFLIKEKVDKHGSKVKSLRASVVLALMKLFQKLPLDTFETKLPKLITVVCNALKNKDSNERDVARETLSKMAVSLDLKYLPLIISEMSVSLSEGYKLHVRSATLHSILVTLSRVYQQPAVDSIDAIASLPFDRCVPAMLDLIHQDIFGKASEIKEAQHVEKRLIKEAMGSKSQDSLEIIARTIHFQPSIITASVKESFPGLAHASAVHALVTPFLERLRDPDVSSSTMRKVRECLNRVAVGFSTNASAKYEEVLPFIYATVAPFVHGKAKPTVEDEDLENSDDEGYVPIQVSGGSSSKKTKQEISTAVAVATWNTSSLGTMKSQSSALEMKKKQKKELHRVTDGAAAPKLTGSSRHSPLKSSKAKNLNNPANACAVGFGLNLLNSSLKKSKIDIADEALRDMADPYLPLLTHCVRFSSDNQAVILSLRCLGVMLRIDLPSVPVSAKHLGPSILEHLTSAGAASNTQSDLVQGCFKTLTLLISHPKFSSPVKNDITESSGDDAKNPKAAAHHETLPLKTDQMQALLSLLHSAVREYDHHNATFGLVKAIAAKRFMSAEFYDLMDIILKLSVQSQKGTVRLQASQIFLQYLIDYPLGEQRLTNHLQQIVLNIKYEYEEGRLSAIELLSSVVQKFPPPVLEERAQFFYLPLVLQLVNDDSKPCKEAVAHCISLLLQRLSTESVQALFGYAKRWSQSSGADSLPMQRASAQLFGIFVDSRPDYVKRGSNASDLVSIVQNSIVQQMSVETNDSGWELLYHNLVCTEKLINQMPAQLSTNYEIWGALVKYLAYPHPWIMQVSSRIINSHLSTMDPHKLMRGDSSELFVVKIPGCLYKIASNLCRQLDVEDVHFVENTSTLAIKTMVWVFRAMKAYPDICYEKGASAGNNDVDDEQLETSKDPCLWVMARLSNIAKPKGDRRRESVFKFYAALATSCDPEHSTPYLELMIDAIDRAIREANNLSSDNQGENDPAIALPKDVLQVLEDRCGTEQFIQAYAEVNRKVREKRYKRKQDIASEAVHDPEAAANRKIKKNLREKERRKRRIEDRRVMRGGQKKRRHS